MSRVIIKSQISLAETAEKMGKKAMERGLIYNFSINFYPDAWQFYLGEKSDSEALTPEEAYLHLRKILEEC